MNKTSITTITVTVLILFLIVEPSTTGSYSKDMLTKYNPVLASTDSAGNTGESSSPTSTSSVWGNGASSPTPKMESAYTAIGDKIYIIAGYGETGKRNKNSVEVYDTKTDTWTTAAPVPVNLNHAAAAALDGKIYLVGGYLDNKIPSDKLFVYDPATDAWQEGNPMPTARAALTAQFIGNVLYAVGGTDDNNPLTVNEAYDPATATWTSKANMPTPRQHMASGVVDDILYVIGGRPKGKSSNIDNNEAYDPKTDT